MMSLLGPFFSPWFILVDLLLAFLVLPRLIGYWIVSQDRHEEFKLVPMLALFLVAGALLFLGVHNGIVPEMVILGLALLITALR